MSIAILTVPLNYNYGGYLQVYALATAVHTLSGGEVVVLNRRPAVLPLSKRLTYTAKTMVKRLLGRTRQPLTAGELSRLKHEQFKRFTDAYLPCLSEPIHSSAQLTEALRLHNVTHVIIGSDQVWRPIYVPDIEDYFGRFAGRAGVPCLTYAASTGTNSPEYTPELAVACRAHYDRLKGISVRENDTATTMEALGFDTSRMTRVLDPTLLHDAAHYRSVMEHPERDNVYGDAAFCYALDLRGQIPAMIEYLRSHAPAGVETLHLLRQSRRSQVPLYPTVQTWLRRFNDASFVLTDSYHGMVFSIIMHRPFAVVNNAERGSSRFTTLLQDLALEDRIVTTTEDLRRIHRQEIDWSEVDRKLSVMRTASLRFLRENLGLYAGEHDRMTANAQSDKSEQSNSRPS